MKKIAILLLSLTVACSTESDADLESKTTNTQVQLTARTIKKYQDGALINVIKEFYENNQLTRAEETNGSYCLYNYKDGLLYQIESFTESDVLAYTIDYSYDDLGRLTNRFSTPGPAQANRVPLERTYSYDQDRITGITTYHAPNPADNFIDTLYYKTNTRGLITRSEKIDAIEGSWGAEVTYQEDNVSALNYYGWRTDFEGEITYSYAGKNNSPVYPIAKLHFGTQWKNNHIFDDTYILQHASFESVGDLYLSGYQHWNTDKTTLLEEVNISYAFDEQDNLIKKTFDLMNFSHNTTFTSEVTYSYN